MVWKAGWFLISRCFIYMPLPLLMSKRNWATKRTMFFLFILGTKSDKEAADRRKLVSKWHPTTKGTLRRNYRVPSKSEGRRLLKAIASLLSDDDHFTDATSRKVLRFNFIHSHCCFPGLAALFKLPLQSLFIISNSINYWNLAANFPDWEIGTS